MRLVSHPNIVDLKAFFYTNGDKVRFAKKDHHSPFSPPPPPPSTGSKVAEAYSELHPLGEGEEAALCYVYNPILCARLRLTIAHGMPMPLSLLERRGFPQPCARVYPRDGVPRLSSLFKDQTDDADASDQAVHVSIVPEFDLYPRARHLSPRHQASEPAAEPNDGHSEAVRFRKVGRTGACARSFPFCPFFLVIDSRSGRMTVGEAKSRDGVGL